ncbi:hypothetical protein I601_0387 [Nocardioides dokdonensis FR1436]|uniref:DUF4349 domain-containing protein n=1 Tax=Nocardioides dokdonensis FR1436 TaxID=1300347 RepID=A0A1A9GES5_9ACTN|nr:DUF4349 domain-containing protein [Nocardioides dokdonensis]ANH36839.1 hypothetical protein I601_0387 [Nocardioides dokdonensis FR1436]
MNPTTRPRRRSRTRLLLATGCLAALTTLAACSGAGDSSAGDSDSAAEPASAGEVAPAPRYDGRRSLSSDADAAEPAGGVADVASSVDSPVREPALISTGTVSLRADDVADTRFDVQKVADRYQGRITDSETRTDEDGEVRDARLVLRVPAAEFTEAMDELEKVADLESSTSSTDDVTTRVVDTAVRIRVQRASIARIEELLQRAGSIRDVVAVESQLTKRQERLNSLLRQQAYLGDQTSMSTITVHVQRTRAVEVTDPEGGSGFVAGLRAGWDGLTTVAVALATVTGAVLPFTVLALLLGLPLWFVLRPVVRRRRAAAGPAQPASSG